MKQTIFSRRRFCHYALGAGALMLAGCGGSDNQNDSLFDATRSKNLLEDYAATYNVIGGGAAVVRGNRLLWSSGFGTANKELKRSATPDTVFLIASISKTITGVAVMQLVEQNKLNLDTDINSYLPFVVRNPAFPDTAITLRHLLAHVSGLSDDYYYAISTPQFFYKDQDPTLSLADFCKEILVPGGRFYDTSTFSANAPGTAYRYCNIAFALIGYIVERAAGEDFASYTKRTLFLPLGMSRSSWRVRDFRAEDMAMPYSETGEAFGNYTFADYPDGALRTTPNDLSRFLRMFMGDGVLDNRRILQAATAREMRRVQYPNLSDGQELAWDSIATDGYSFLLGHEGAESGVGTLMRYNPATNTGVILFQNQGAADLAQGFASYTLATALIRLGEAA